MVLTKIEPKTMLDCVIEAIRKYILENNLPIGGSLPTEAEFTEKLGVGRSVVREALRHYRTLGIIESHPKRGATLAQILPIDPYAAYRPFLSKEKYISRNIAEVRAILEIGAAPIVVERITSAQCAKLRFIAEKMSVCQDYSAYFKLDNEFHSNFLRLVANPIFNSLIPLTIDFWDELYRKESKRKRWKQDVATDSHLLIVEALETHDVKLLELLVDCHTSCYYQDEETVEKKKSIVRKALLERGKTCV